MYVGEGIPYISGTLKYVAKVSILNDMLPSFGFTFRDIRKKLKYNLC